MGRKNLLDKSFNQIEQFFDAYRSKSFNHHKIREIINENRDNWEIPNSKSVKNIINYLIKKKVLFPFFITNSLNEVNEVYAWKTKDIYTIVSGIKTNLYFAFYSALYFHGLTLQIPKTIYLNKERSFNLNLSSGDNLSQNSIDHAFNKPQRKSKNVYKYNEKRIFITNGKFTDKLGVYAIESPEKNKFYYCTDLERTLIDISVRPVYSGGVFEVLEAYKLAKEKVDIALVFDYLEELDYTYPYEQVIGFYMEKAGYDLDEISTFFNKENKYNFYLTYEMRKKEYNEKWKLYYPKGM